jgi:hypothetical protein
VLATFVVLCILALVASASAETREYTLQWLQSDGPEPSGYLTYLGEESGAYSEVLDLGPVSPDPDGMRRATLILDADTSYYIAISAYNDLGESLLSNEIFSASAVCLASFCDDGNPCTADDCSADGCVHMPMLDGAPCNPGDGGFGLCSDSSCQPADCLLDSDCNDGDVCNGIEACSSSGVCVSGIPLSCAEPTQCQAPACDLALGCVMFPVADGSPCDDGDAWTKGDRCEAGFCVGRARGKGAKGGNGRHQGSKK